MSSTRGDMIVHDETYNVYRIQTSSGVLVGAEYGGNPLALESHADAVDLMERRADLPGRTQ